MHFTYQPPDGDLQQGDLLERTVELQEVLQRFHPYYHQHQDYQKLIILTQSCDLVRNRRGEGCKAQYISLAAVRPFSTVLTRELEICQRSPREKRLKYCSLKGRSLMHQFLGRLLNNNEEEFFYLHQDADIGISEPLVAFLPLSVSILANEHYEICLRARSAQLTDTFQAKLGWLVGNMYSRVATEDWVPRVCNDEEFQQHIEAILENLCVWVDDRHMEKISREERRRKRERGENYLMSEDDLANYIDQLEKEREGKKDQIIERAIELLEEIQPGLDRNVLRRRMKNDSALAALLR